MGVRAGVAFARGVSAPTAAKIIIFDTRIPTIIYVATSWVSLEPFQYCTTVYEHIDIYVTTIPSNLSPRRNCGPRRLKGVKVANGKEPVAPQRWLCTLSPQ